MEAGEPRKSVCLYRRGGPHWWRVDAEIAANGTLTLTSGDSHEWQAVVAAGDVPALLAALRRGGDLLAAVGGDRDDELLARLHERFGGGDGSRFEAFRAFLDAHAIPWEGRFWAGDAPADGEEGDLPPAAPAPSKADAALAALLREAAALARRPGNDFTWSGWAGAREATAELDALASALETGAPADRIAIAALFAPAGPMQELAMASGWTVEFLDLAERFDAACR